MQDAPSSKSFKYRSRLQQNPTEAYRAMEGSSALDAVQPERMVEEAAAASLSKSI
jgi:hypothetical protein